MTRVIAANLRGRVSLEDIEDMASDAVVRLMRAVRRGGIESLKAMQVTIAKRTAIDRLRKKGWTLPAGGDFADPDAVVNLAAPSEELDESTSRIDIEFYLRELFELLPAGCRQLFEHWIETLNLKVVAQRLGITHVAVRKRRERCQDRAREILAADTGPLGAWARELT
jgi:RNA polymerase sigma factor (sigma-70 family)